MKDFPHENGAMNPAAQRERLRSIRGPRYWRSLEDAARTEAFRELLHREFTPTAAAEIEPLDRRSFLRSLGASMALAGITACTKQPVERLVPYVRQPETLVPGEPRHYATTMTLGGFGTGLLVESHDGRPTKIEGNPEHPMSLGATHVFHQASLLDLYDPDRSQAVLHGGQISGWNAYLGAMHEALRGSSAPHGVRLRILTETVASPTLSALMQAVLERFPNARWHQFEPVNRDHEHAGARLAFGEVVAAHYHFAKADVVLALDADLLFAHPATLRLARDFAGRRRASSEPAVMNRFYAVETTPTVTGSNADHRLALRSNEMEMFAWELMRRLGGIAEAAPSIRSPHERWLKALAEDLQRHRGRCLVAAGAQQSPLVHALAHAMNDALGNVGRTVHYTAPAEAHAVNQLQSLRELAEDLENDRVDVLLMLGGNPAYAAPSDFEFARRLTRARLRIHLSPDVNETSALCQWHLPQSHYLESWGDARAFDGTVSLIQPLILPLYAGKSDLEVIDSLLGQPVRGDYDIVRDHWKREDRWEDFENGWRRTVHDGWMADTASPSKEVRFRAEEWPEPAAPTESLEVVFRPDPTVWDGRFANNGWLQELPKPITKLTWDNAALIAPATARNLNLENGDVVVLELEGRNVRVPVWLTPGQAQNSVALHLGYGRTRVGRVGAGAGCDAFMLRSSNSLWTGRQIRLEKTDAHHSLACTQNHQVIDSDERQVYREATWREYQADHDIIRRHTEEPAQDETLFRPEEHRYDGYHWGMSIDLGACIGCNACVLACQAENNIPVVGKEQVAKGREMHWIRIDTWLAGSPDEPRMAHQPVPCMHCENAPCELVCPVAATVHDKEGLNLQVYNRCIGTRYCSNNCPYKVRRFNFFQYADRTTPSLKPMRNPDVTVRSRGVMEKCTYCIQRISRARIAAKREGRPIADGAIQTACQQACPAQAIVFGDIRDADTQVSKLKKLPLNFSMLGQLNTRPRTTYLAKLRHPNPSLANDADETRMPGGAHA